MVIQLHKTGPEMRCGGKLAEKLGIPEHDLFGVAVSSHRDDGTIDIRAATCNPRKKSFSFPCPEIFSPLLACEALLHEKGDRRLRERD